MREEIFFVINSDISQVNDIIQKILVFSQDVFSSTAHLEVALYEAIYNAIEHGNFEIDFREKERMIEEGTFDKFIAERSKTNPYAHRKVKIKSEKDAEKQVFIIMDEGRGFDWKKQYDEVKDNDLYLGVNGRGMKIMTSVFDKVIYNEKGNEVCLVKKRDKKF